jgi:hypothetical protein
MPAVLCGLKCFDVPVSSTAGSLAREFSASLNPALNGAGCPVEVYRLERLGPDVQLAPDDLVVCHIPGWQFDFAALEELHRQVEELRLEYDNLDVQYNRTKEILISLNASVEANEAVESPTTRRGLGTDSRPRDHRREVEQLKMQLTQSERKQQETKATVMALRSEFMHLVDMMSGPGSVAQNIDVAADLLKPPRQLSQPPVTPGSRRPIGTGSPRTYRAKWDAPTSFTTPRPCARPRGVHQRNGHSAGASVRQRSNGECM